MSENEQDCKRLLAGLTVTKPTEPGIIHLEVWLFKVSLFLP